MSEQIKKQAKESKKVNKRIQEYEQSELFLGGIREQLPDSIEALEVIGHTDRHLVVKSDVSFGRVSFDENTQCIQNRNKVGFVFSVDDEAVYDGQGYYIGTVSYFRFGHRPTGGRYQMTDKAHDTLLNDAMTCSTCHTSFADSGQNIHELSSHARAGGVCGAIAEARKRYDIPRTKTVNLVRQQGKNKGIIDNLNKMKIQEKMDHKLWQIAHVTNTDIRTVVPEPILNEVQRRYMAYPGSTKMKEYRRTKLKKIDNQDGYILTTPTLGGLEDTIGGYKLETDIGQKRTFLRRLTDKERQRVNFDHRTSNEFHTSGPAYALFDRDGKRIGKKVPDEQLPDALRKQKQGINTATKI